MEKRAQRFRNWNPTQDNLDEKLFNAALDETGTVSMEAVTTTPSETDSIETTITTKETEGIENIGEGIHELLQVHGTEPKRKAEGVTRLIYENLNGINSIITGNEKLENSKQVIDDLEADIGIQRTQA